ncbi:MAG: hypothetical protein AB1345_14615 [Chloroflexota bacterium]
MKTRQGSGIEALSQETESDRSATPTSRRHPLTLPADRLRRGYAWRVLPESATPEPQAVELSASRR